MDSIGQRLKEERKRLGYNQTEFAQLGGVQKNAQSNYEGDTRRPDADYLAAIAALGADVLFVVTGQRSAAAIPTEEKALLEGYRALDARGRAGVLALVGGMQPPAPAPARTGMVFHGQVGEVKNVEGDFHQNEPVTFNLGTKKKRTK